MKRRLSRGSHVANRVVNVGTRRLLLVITTTFFKVHTHTHTPLLARLKVNGERGKSAIETSFLTVPRFSCSFSLSPFPFQVPTSSFRLVHVFSRRLQDCRDNSGLRICLGVKKHLSHWRRYRAPMGNRLPYTNLESPARSFVRSESASERESVRESCRNSQRNNVIKKSQYVHRRRAVPQHADNALLKTREPPSLNCD